MTENNERLEAKIRSYRNLKQYQNKTPEEVRALAIKYLEMPKAGKKLQEANIIEFATDKEYLNLSFKERPAQEVILRVIYGLPLNKKQLKIYYKITKNRKEFEAGLEKEEAILVLGARSGKSLIASVIALYEGTRKKWSKYLNRGESGYIEVISTKQKQSEQIIGANCLRLMENSPKLKGYVRDHTQSELILKNNMRILSLPCNSTAGRGLPVVCLIFDEIGHFYTEGVRADETIFNALRPRQAQFPGAKLVLISTPSAKQGLLWNFFDDGFKTAGRLTAQAETLFMNPLVDQKFLQKEKKRDIDNYRREFLAEFAEKVEAFLSYDLVAGALKLAGDLPYKAEYRYYAGIDASGLAGRDKFALAITHKQDNKVYVDKSVTWNLSDPDPIMKDIKELTGIYHINKASIDKYAKGWVQNALEKIGLEVNIRPSLAEIYVNIKSLMLGDRLYLPDNQGIKKAFLNTQAYYGRNNQLSIAHERDSAGHSDEADAISTSVFEAIKEESVPGFYISETTQKKIDEESWQKLENWGDLTGQKFYVILCL
ncbi:hypothetical protein ES695_03310 [Candidatus Atribacteria bacterium 1244-E10-H5-B2]|nr:MAG: hypothetical protein ES695_03310 [Candidatus Atribacteria bacterium 1244-E10-H5-B2]